MLVGNARVSTQDQKPELQPDALKAVGCEKVFVEKVFVEKALGAQRDRPELKAALDDMRDGDTLVVWKLDRPARTIKHLIETDEGLEEVGVGFRSLKEAIDTTTPFGAWTLIANGTDGQSQGATPPPHVKRSEEQSGLRSTHFYLHYGPLVMWASAGPFPKRKRLINVRISDYFFIRQ